MKRPPATILAYYQDPKSAQRALRHARRSGFRRAAAIHRPRRGRVVVADNDVSPRLGALLGGAVALGALAAYFSIPFRLSGQVAAGWAMIALLAVIGAAAGWLLARWIDLGVSNRLLARYQRWVVPDESLVIVQAPSQRASSGLALLRQGGGGQPATFAIRPLPVFPKPAREVLRRERSTTERLKRRAARLAASHTLAPRPGRAHPLWGRLSDSERTIGAIHGGLAEAARLDQSISLAAEWLLDNAYVIQRHIGDVRRNLSRGFYDVLPLLETGPQQGEPRVYQLAWELVARTEADVQVEDIVDFVLAYEEVSPLTMGELWALPLMLRLALIEHLSALAVQIDLRQHDHERADFWANRLLHAARRDPDQLLFMLAELSREQPDPAPYFADRLVSQLQGEALALEPVRVWLERKAGTPLPELLQQEQRRQAADQVMIANAITSLRRLSQLDWRDVFERVSAVDRVLREDPAGVYPRMDFDTRDRYRHAVEEISRRSGLQTSEVDVARLAVAAARREATGARPPGARERREGHVGYFLIDAGRWEVEAGVRYRAPLPQRALRWALRHPALVYLGGISVATAGVLTGTLAIATLRSAGGAATAHPALLIPIVLLALVPASEVGVQVVNYLVTQLLPPRPPPKLSFEDGIPDEWRTLVVVPMILLTPESVRDDLERLEIRFLANQDRNLHYALLADLPDAPKREMPADAALLEVATQGIEQLNARYDGNRFSLFHRGREWSETEQAWMGWERKRGKLEDLNRLLTADTGGGRAGAPAPTGSAREAPQGRGSRLQHVGDASQLRGVRFVITLDADTQLPHNTARRLVETLAHPLNRPRLAVNGRTVEGGCTIIQPRVSTSLPSALATRFSRFFTDPVGTDPYTRAVSDVYQDLAGEGSYHGKGIYDVQTFHRVLSGRFPEALLLSHDLLEGAHVRVGLASDIELFDLFPSDYLAYASREHRWIRGDWQIADWCGPRVPAGRAVPEEGAKGSGGKREANPLSAINRWKIFDNLRRSLLPVAAVALLAAGWLLIPGAGALWSGFVGLVLFLPPFLQLITLPLTQPRTALQALLDRRAWPALGAAWVRAALAAALLPHQASVALDAIVRAWYRRLVSHRHLLEWHTSQRQRERRLLWQMGGGMGLAAVLGGAVMGANPAALPAAAPFLSLWLLSPAIVAWLNGRRRRPATESLTASDRLLLRRMARQTWRYFDDFVGPQTHWLPPDNYQEALRTEVAQRTSPTNIGLWLLSTVTAHDFGYLTLDQAVDRGLATMETLHKLERFEGHLLNWYHTQTLEPLPPRYVSSVDSGNLLASLWTLSQGYEELLSRPVIGPAALRGLEDTLALVREWPASELPAGAPGHPWHAPPQASALAPLLPGGAAQGPPDGPGNPPAGPGRAGSPPGSWRTTDQPRDRIAGLIETLGALFGDPPDHLGEIVRRLRAAAGPAKELASAMRALQGTPGDRPGQTEGTGRSIEGIVVQGAGGAYWTDQVERQVTAWLTIVERYLPWVEDLARETEALAVLGEAAQAWRRQALARAPSLRAIASGAYSPARELQQAVAGFQAQPVGGGAPSAGAGVARHPGPGAQALAHASGVPEPLPEPLRATLAEVDSAASRARWLAGEALAQANRLIAQASDLAAEMNMRFLYDPERRLFSIGYSVTERRLDPSYYDLLASEARLGSFAAIARGDVPVEHWLALGRPFGPAVGGARLGGRVLLSWSGTMFEYLMPLLLTRSYENSLLGAACRAAVAWQIKYAARRGVPWGMSESAFSAVDSHQIYQYQAFGVPGLGLKRGLEEDLIVAPYATALALAVEPRAAVQNLRRLARLGVRGPYGYYEAIDFTRRRQTPGERGVVVYAYMAHHQGMTLLAASNALHEKVLQARFHADARVRAAEPLLFERIPLAPPLVEGAAREEAPPRFAPPAAEETTSRFTSPDTPVPRTQLLSNGAYSVTLTSAGGGYSRWRDVDISRWRADTTLDGWGSFCYVKDLEQGTVWATAHQPVRRATAQYAATFGADRVTFERRDAGIGTQTEITVSPEDDAELRRLTLINYSSRPRQLEVTSYVELALASHSADRAHPAFSKLFVQTEALVDGAGRAALLAWRKPRVAHEPPAWAAHVLAPPAGTGGTAYGGPRPVGGASQVGLRPMPPMSPGTQALAPADGRAGRPEAPSPASDGVRGDWRPAGATSDVGPGTLDWGGQAVQFETDRARFLGRGRSTENPAALEGDLSNSAGSVLDPIFSLRCRVTIAPGQRLRLAFVTAAAETREAVLRLVEKYADLRATDRAFELAWSQAQLEPRHLRVGVAALQRYQHLAGYMLYPSPRLRAAEQQLRQNRLGPSRLWAYGISGDLPIMAVTIGDERDIDLVREALVAHTYWRMRGLKADLVILDEEAGGYQQPLHESLKKLVQAQAQYTGVDQPGGVFLRSVDQMPAEDLTLLLASARVVLVAARGSIAQQLSTPPEVGARVPPPFTVGRRAGEEPSAPLPFMELPYFNGLGGFTPDGKEYAIYLGPGTQTPAPWVNVMANPHFGALVSESGQGFAWYGNSQSNRLLPWSNDPVCDPVGEAIYVRDDNTGVVWTPTPLPIRELDAYRARHGQGYTLFEHNSHAIEQELVMFVPMDEAGGAPVRVQRLRLRNRSSRRRRLTVTAYAEWALGGTREETQMHVVTSWDAESRALLARNAFHPDYAGRVAFAAAGTAAPPLAALPARWGAASYTADRSEFLGRNGTPARPAGLARQSLSGRAGAGLDPCAALQVVVEFDPGQDSEVIFLLGQAADAAQARLLVQRFRDPDQVEQALQTTRGWWDRLLDTVQVETPDLAVNFLLNRWLLYQTLSCRFWARSAFYQSGGAYGFRDQLQDCMALVYAAPQLARQQLLEAAAHQFVEGDVQHWWHPPSGAGVRTRISDDLLWLPYVTMHYVRTTGDAQVLDEPAPFLEGRQLEEDEHDVYFVPTPTLEQASLLEHCRRAIARGLSPQGRGGPHGLPLIGTGDWNDGLNLVGAGGKGESVWLAWFLIDILEGFAALLDQRGETAEADEYRTKARHLGEAVEAQGWDGAWYRRAYFDDGTPLGSREREEARIDSLPQSWGVISGAADPARAERALQAVEEHLVRDEEKLILLFTPPFSKSSPDPGYIRGYPPGVRENGGQYTHAAVWVALAFALRGDGDRAVALLRMLNPVEHARTPEDAARYKVEPYVAAADVYALEGRVGQGGWTWYTGSSGWMYRVWLEDVLGFKLRGSRLILDPVVPSAWERFSLRYRHGDTHYEILVENPDRVCRGVAWLELDGQRLGEREVPLRDDGAPHHVVVRLGTASGDGPLRSATAPARTDQRQEATG